MLNLVGLLLLTTVTNAAVHLPLYNFGGYLWYVNLSIGSPPVSFNFTIDTGSSDFIAIGTDCPSDVCGVPAAFAYNVSASKSAIPITCDTAKAAGVTCEPLSCTAVENACSSNVDYGGSMTETFNLVRDVVSIGSVSAQTILGDVFNFTMALRGRHFQSALLNPVGMWGLAYRSLTSSGAVTFFDNLVAQSNGTIDDRFYRGGLSIPETLYNGETLVVGKKISGNAASTAVAARLLREAGKRTHTARTKRRTSAPAATPPREHLLPVFDLRRSDRPLFL
jgi:hypothetical protein